MTSFFNNCECFVSWFVFGLRIADGSPQEGLEVEKKTSFHTSVTPRQVMKKHKLNLFQRDGKRFHNFLLILTLLILLAMFRCVRMDIEPTNTLHQRNCRELDIARSPHVGLEII